MFERVTRCQKVGPESRSALVKFSQALHFHSPSPRVIGRITPCEAISGNLRGTQTPENMERLHSRGLESSVERAVSVTRQLALDSASGQNATFLPPKEMFGKLLQEIRKKLRGRGRWSIGLKIL